MAKPLMIGSDVFDGRLVIVAGISSLAVRSAVWEVMAYGNKQRWCF
ncbi:hypothetical protein [Corynebacterium ulcerans]